MSGMAMGSMAMGGKIPMIDYPKMYWAVVGTAIGIATLVNIYNNVLCRQRMAAARAGSSRPAKPQSLFFQALATLFAITREASNFSVRIPIKNRIFRLPTLGRASLIIGNIIVLVVLSTYGFDVSDRWSREDLGYQTGFVTIGQLPLLFLLAGKNNIIGYLTGVSHERLNWLHRWCARCLLLTATMHMGYFFADWAPFNYIGTELRINNLAWRGIAAWAVLVWIVFSSMTPIRGLCYEFFVVQHIVSFAVFIGFVYIHTPAECHGYIWACVAIFWFDRVFRGLRALYASISIFHPKSRKEGQISGFWSCKAEFTPLSHNTTRVVINNPPIRWTPGQHVFLSCQSVAPLQNHPFTVASIPADKRMEFLIKAESGGTKRFFKYAEKSQSLATTGRTLNKSVTIEGPYGCIRPLRQFDSIVLLAGSTGATFTMPLLRDVLQGWKEKSNADQSASSFFSLSGAATRHVRFVWVVKSRGQLEWFSEQLSAVYADFQSLQERLRDIKLDISIYVTCDDTFTEEHKTLLSNITAPNLDIPSQRTDQVIYSRTPLDEKDNTFQTKEDVKEVTSEVRSETYIPNRTCLCSGTTGDSCAQDGLVPSCCCGPSTSSRSSARPPSRASSTAPSTTSKPKLLVHPSISVICGRPNPKNIIRRSLEQALGESAVVVCGPQGLVADVKQDVCVLSDERAVYKGTGAQGIYLHTESFGY